jgi:hypothetical protein
MGSEWSMRMSWSQLKGKAQARSALPLLMA